MEVIMQNIDLSNLDKSTWGTFKFEDIAQKISKTIKPDEAEVDIYIGLEHIDANDIHIRRKGVPADVKGGKLRCYPGDVIFGKRRAYQRKAAIVDFDGICSAHAFVFRANEEIIEAKLFPFFLHSDQFMHRMIDISVGGLSPTINWGDLKQQEFLLPPKDQQAKLAELLWAMDEVIERENVVLKKVESSRLSTEKYCLAKINLKNGINSETFFDRVTDGTHDTPKRKNEGYRLLTSKNISNYSLNLSTDYFISEKDYNEVNKRSKPDKNDILFGMIGTVGQVCMIIEEPDFAIKNMGLFKTRDPIRSKIGFHYFKSRQFQFNLNAQLSGTTQKYVSLGYLRGLKLPNPADKNVLNWIIKAEQYDSLISTIMNKISSSKALQKSLINQVF
jgi:type I restriction enzyme S subunit